jgi:trans-aconitate methyltransferase
VSQYLERALAGETATVQEWNDHLIAFHAAYDRIGEHLIEQMRTPGGENSYELLASCIRELAPKAQALLDIGCGDGTLLVEIERRFGPRLALTGIDLVEPDIAQARRRLPAATFFSGDALDVDMGPTSQDVVTSHLTFMAMPALDRVLARARLALREHGLLAFVIEDALAGEILELGGTAAAAVRGKFPSFSPGTPGREAIERANVMQDLLERMGFARISIEPFVVSAKLSAAQMWQLIEATYPFGLLDTPMRAYVHEAISARIDEIIKSGRETTLAFRLVTAHT